MDNMVFYDPIEHLSEVLKKKFEEKKQQGIGFISLKDLLAEAEEELGIDYQPKWHWTDVNGNDLIFSLKETDKIDLSDYNIREQ